MKSKTTPSTVLEINRATTAGAAKATPVRVLIVGQTPPPYRGGQIILEYLVKSQMPGVKLEHLRIELSSQENQAGRFRLAKVFRMFGFIGRMIHARFTARPQILYWVPSLDPRMTMLRDAVILGTTRFLFPRTIMHCQSSDFGEYYDRLPRWQKWMFRWGFCYAYAAIRSSVHTPEDGKALRARHEFIVPNGIPDPYPDGPPDRQNTPVTRNHPLRVLFVGLLCEAKGILDLIDACADLKARGVPIRVEVMGPFQSAEFGRRVEARVAQLGIADTVEFLGLRTGEEKLAAYARADVLCHPTYYDTFPTVLLEAISAGLPVVSTYHSGIPSMVDEGQTGYLVNPRNPQAVADRLAALAEDVDLRLRMGTAAREKFCREFTLSRYRERMRQVFLDVAAGRHQQPGAAA